MRKLAVIFPGIGYTADKPLLYYSRKIAAKYDYDIMIMEYTGVPSRVKGDKKRMKEFFESAFEQSMKALSGVDMAACSDVLFVGKSIGTVIAAKIAAESPVQDRIRLILYTPLEDTFSYPIKEAVAFTGGDDPWVGREKSPVLGLCEKYRIPCTLVPNANHSLESGDAFADMEELYKVMKETEQFILHS